MVVITRRPHESIVIGEVIRITLESIYRPDSQSPWHVFITVRKAGQQTLEHRGTTGSSLNFYDTTWGMDIIRIRAHDARICVKNVPKEIFISRDPE